MGTSQLLLHELMEGIIDSRHDFLSIKMSKTALCCNSISTIPSQIKQRKDIDAAGCQLLENVN